MPLPGHSRRGAAGGQVTSRSWESFTLGQGKKIANGRCCSSASVQTPAGPGLAPSAICHRGPSLPLSICGSRGAGGGTARAQPSLPSPFAPHLGQEPCDNKPRGGRAGPGGSTCQQRARSPARLRLGHKMRTARPPVAAGAGAPQGTSPPARCAAPRPLGLQLLSSCHASSRGLLSPAGSDGPDVPPASRASPPKVKVPRSPRRCRAREEFGFISAAAPPPRSAPFAPPRATSPPQPGTPSHLGKRPP